MDSTVLEKTCSENYLISRRNYVCKFKSQISSEEEREREREREEGGDETEQREEDFLERVKVGQTGLKTAPSDLAEKTIIDINEARVINLTASRSIDCARAAVRIPVCLSLSLSLSLSRLETRRARCGSSCFKAGTALRATRAIKSPVTTGLISLRINPADATRARRRELAKQPRSAIDADADFNARRRPRDETPAPSV